MTPRFLLAAAVLIAVPPLPARAQPAANARRGARTRPAVDHVKDLFDEYTQGKERERFFAAAGVDSVVTLEEFKAAAGKGGGFVRSYDSWQAAAVHDADTDGKLTWAEAEQYRQGIRKRVMKMFDKNGDGKLTGAERDEANRYLSRGLRAPETGVRRRRGPDPGRRTRQYDTNGDGQIDETERAAMREAWRRRAQQWRQRRELRRYDANKDGKLDGEERAAADKARAEQQAQQEKRRREWTIRRHDKDGDGQLNEQEQAAADAERERWRRSGEQMRQRYREWQNRWDSDGDGELSAEERQAAQVHARAEFERRRKEIDTDGDGRISGEEGRAYLKKLQDKYDADGDGQLDAEERGNLIREESRSFMPGRRRGRFRGRRGRRRGARTERREGQTQPQAKEETGAVIIRTSP